MALIFARRTEFIWPANVSNKLSLRSENRKSFLYVQCIGKISLMWADSDCRRHIFYRSVADFIGERLRTIWSSSHLKHSEVPFRASLTKIALSDIHKKTDITRIAKVLTHCKYDGFSPTNPQREKEMCVLEKKDGSSKKDFDTDCVGITKGRLSIPFFFLTMQREQPQVVTNPFTLQFL